MKGESRGTAFVPYFWECMSRQTASEVRGWKRYNYPSIKMGYNYWSMSLCYILLIGKRGNMWSLTHYKSQGDSSHRNVASQIHSQKWPWSIARVAAGQYIPVHCLACWQLWISIRGPYWLIESDVLPYHWICKRHDNWSILLRMHFDRTHSVQSKSTRF